MPVCRASRRLKSCLVTGTGNSNFAAIGSDASRRCPPHVIYAREEPANCIVRSSCEPAQKLT
jgi:hypothetical protein